jgi:hypothetical protein
MTGDGSDWPTERVFVRPEEDVRREFSAASYEVWLGLISLLGRRWEAAADGHIVAGSTLRCLSDLARLRCRPDGRPLPAGTVFECLVEDVSRDGKTPLGVVESRIVRGFAGSALSGRTPAEITGLIEAFLRCYAADYERGELTWVDELYGMVRSGGPAASWTVELPKRLLEGDDATVVLHIPAAALEAACLRAGDQLLIEPRAGGLWLGRAPHVSGQP